MQLGKNNLCSLQFRKKKYSENKVGICPNLVRAKKIFGIQIWTYFAFNLDKARNFRKDNAKGKEKMN